MTVSKASLSKVQYTTPISDIPDAPTIVSATNVGTSRAFNNGAVTVTLSDAVTGGVTTSYTVTSDPSSYSATSTSPVTVTGLASNTSYTFSAVGNNTTGTGATSSASGSVTSTTTPDAPTSVSASATSATVATISFTPPVGTGGSAITGYTIVSSPSISITTQAGTTSPLTATGTFAGNTAYTFTIAAINANGTGTASSATNSIAPNATYDLSQTFNSSGTYTVPAGKSKVAVVMVGGGASGSGRSPGVGSKIQSFYEYSVNPSDTFAVGVAAAAGSSTFGNIANVSTGASSGPTNFATGNGGNAGGGSAGNVSFTTNQTPGLSLTQQGGGGGGNSGNGASPHAGWGPGYGGGGGGQLGGGHGGQGGAAGPGYGAQPGQAGQAGQANTGGGGGAGGQGGDYYGAAGTGSAGAGGTGKVWVYVR
jgi:hypothetical protein